MMEAMIRKFAGSPFTLSKLNTAAADRLSGAELRAAMPDLLHKGQVAAVKKSWGIGCITFQGMCSMSTGSTGLTSGLIAYHPLASLYDRLLSKGLWLIYFVD
ncbi:hypothetical protein RE628_09400 [Paenibacillus sp. D2_2]|uniref:hypothetical protein n=1 Tax=Paenibacillus sp. D2_2 TaxID=3073092 RepID=UPI002815DC44|nr:hypothetical protein [Paenibacillus sp. D2_2]WMT42527.1 hypothetical protein RE628_09400 [Paenibacillus sp. D2_2]